MTSYLEDSKLAFARALEFRSPSEYRKRRDAALARLAEDVANGAQAAGFHARALGGGRYVFHTEELNSPGGAEDHLDEGAVLLFVSDGKGNFQLRGVRGTREETIALTYDSGTDEVSATPTAGDNRYGDAGKAVAEAIINALKRNRSSQ